MIDFWDQLPTWLQQVIAITGWVLALLGRLWSRLPKRFSLFDRIYVNRKKGKQSIQAWGVNVFLSGPDSVPSQDRNKDDGQSPKPTTDPAQQADDQQPRQPGQQQDQQATRGSPDDRSDQSG